MVDPSPEEPELPPPPFFPPFTFQKRLKFKSESDFFFFRRAPRREAMPLAKRPVPDPLPDKPQPFNDEFLARLEDIGRRSLPELPEPLPIPLRIPFFWRTSKRPSAVRGR